jgi:3-oxoacyl-[acyl-carrier-protein] synthase II
MGIVSPLGVGVNQTWSNLLSGQTGISRIERFDTSDLPSRIAGLVPRGANGFDPLSVVSKLERRRVGEFIVYALAASAQAVTDAGIVDLSEDEQDRVGVLIGSGVGGLPFMAENAVALHERGPRRVSPFFISGSLINEASGVVSIRHGFRGPNHAVVTACTSGASAIGDAARLIALHDADAMLAGGVEAATCRLTLASFSIMRALSTAYNEDPGRASRPWDRDRDGFVLGEGAGMLMLEELERAKRRGATIYAELLGYGLSGDAHHVSAPDPSGRGARKAMQAALDRAKINPSEVDYINAHATSTELGDPAEIAAARSVFGSDVGDVSISSTKSATGHLLGAAGAVEAILSIQALRTGVAPATLNLENPDPSCADLDLVPLQPKERRIRHVMSNSFGFGGSNASLVFGPPP